MRIISGQFRGTTLFSPHTEAVRPTSEQLRAALFNICQAMVVDASFLDLFAGSGAMGLEALSRGAAKSTFVDQDKMALQCIKKNIEKLHVEEISLVIQLDAFQALKRFISKGESFDIIYVDPPYRMKPFCNDVLKIVDESSLLNPGGMLFLEEEALRGEKPFENELKTLYLKSKRQFGSSILRQYTQEAI